jgi:hypothetical protein
LDWAEVTLSKTGDFVEFGRLNFVEQIALGQFFVF